MLNVLCIFIHSLTRYYTFGVGIRQYDVYVTEIYPASTFLWLLMPNKREERKKKRSSFILCNMQKRYIFCCCCWSGSLHSIHIPRNDIASSSLSRFSNGICRRLSPSAELIAFLFTQTHRHTALRSMISMMELLSCESNYKQIKYDNHFSYSYFCSSYFAC